MPKTPRGKRVPEAAGETFVVVDKAPNGAVEPFFDRTRESGSHVDRPVNVSDLSAGSVQTTKFPSVTERVATGLVCERVGTPDLPAFRASSFEHGRGRVGTTDRTGATT